MLKAVPFAASEMMQSAVVGSGITLPTEKAQPVYIPRIEKAPVIDGRLDDEAWHQAVVLMDFYQIQPGDNIQPSKPTELLLAYDAKSLYIAFRAADDPDKVRATIAKRDAVSEDDNVRILLDTFNDQRKAYIFVFNPLGVQQDGILTEGRGEDYDFDLVMESKGMLTNGGYTVEATIPFKSLRYEAGKDRLWGIHAFRRIKRFNNELDSWMPISRDRSGLLNQAGHLVGLEEISSGRTLELIPSLTLSETGARVRALPVHAALNDPVLIDPGRFVNAPLKHDPSLTAKLVITPTTTLDFTLNPDFAQVESDQTVVTTNQRFPIFFEEKRPFFLEGIDIFQTPMRPVHTRAIVDPDVAVKLTGKRGRNTFGLLFASDSAPGNFSEEERSDPATLHLIRPLIGHNAAIAVLRLKRDIGADSQIGLTGTSYNFVERHNQLASLDGRFRLNPQTFFRFQAIETTTSNVGNGFGYFLNYEKSGRHFSYDFSGVGRTRDYRADVGFTQRTNTNHEVFVVKYNSEPKPKAVLISWSLVAASSAEFDWQGRLQSWGEEPTLTLNFGRQTALSVLPFVGYERVFEEEFGPKRGLGLRGAFAGDDSERSANNKGLQFTFETTPSQKYSASLLVARTWGQLDFDFGAGPRFPRVSPAALLDPDAPLDPGPGNLWEVNATVVYQPTTALRTSLDYTKSRLARPDTKLLAFDENTFAWRTTYQFTRFTFVRARVDYDTLLSTIRGQFLLGWTPNPGTSFYAGYNNDLNRNGFSPFSGQLESGLRRNGQTFFIKMSYLFRRSF